MARNADTPTADLIGKLRAREQEIKRERAELDREAAAIERGLTALGRKQDNDRPRRSNARTTDSLDAAIVRVLNAAQGKPLSPGQVRFEVGLKGTGSTQRVHARLKRLAESGEVYTARGVHPSLGPSYARPPAKRRTVVR